MRKVIANSLRLAALGQFGGKCHDVIASDICAIHRGDLERFDRSEHLLLRGTHRSFIFYVPIDGIR
ncbi:hypothetical protein [Agrobacterium sp.]|uniref:hypothetical protein n=1 Tax=Agrobacterium sp. TaxID=361 RepID=UPI0039180656